MTPQRASKLKIGDRVRTLHSGHPGVVDMVTHEGNYIRVQWDRVKRADILARTSPLWANIEVMAED